MTTLSAKKRELTQLFSTVSDSPSLDAICIITHVTSFSHATLISDGDKNIDKTLENKINLLAQKRLDGIPIAYLVGTKDFWSLELYVSADTLIPRPETECLVQWVLEHFSNKDNCHIADLGTGTGAIAIALACEKPHWMIHATDLSKKALTVAEKNAKKYHCKHLSFYQGNWCQALPESNYDIIISNPPYIAQNDPHLKKLTHEPQSALVAGPNGLSDYQKIIPEAYDFLNSPGYLVLEHGYNQALAIQRLCKKNGYQNIETHHDLANTPRFTTAQKI